ncbi:alpha/beta hydrolase [Candidatus Lokiarchaeum ossiferum]|uniref:alpha/beta hydrolase n=1 Tax=Candidatus Lokiarchaeum ossiferum TaxID=2951803 RepID=UPI00352BFE79
MEKRFQIENRLGYELHSIHYFSSPESSSSKPLVILIHGYCGDKENMGFNAEGFELGRFTKLAKALLQEGYEVLSFDLFGHGENIREPLRISNFVMDVEDIYAWAKNQGYTRIGTVAYSLGGNASIHAQLPERKVAVFWSPAFYPTRSKGKLKVFFYKILAKFMKSPVKDGANFGDVLVDGTFLQESIRGTSDNVLQKFVIPTLIVHGKSDMYVRWEWSQEAYNKMPHDEKHQFQVVENAEHHYDKDLLQQFIDPTVAWLKIYL